MIELGKIQVLEVVRESDFGVYLNSKEEKSENDILLPNKQLDSLYFESLNKPYLHQSPQNYVFPNEDSAF